MTIAAKIDSDHVVVLTEVSNLKPYPKNAKIHSEEQVDRLVALIRKFGWTSPITYQKSSGEIVTGHGRRLAALKMGLKRVPAICLDVSDEEASALRIADNRVVSTDYDADMLKDEIGELAEAGFDLSLLAFDEKELNTLIADMGDIDASVFVDDISEAVDEQKAANAKAQDDIEGSAAPVRDAFGFTRVTVAQSRRIRAFMTRIEKSTGQRGADALMVFFDQTEPAAP